MPVLSGAPYDTAEYVLNLARSIVNDAAQTIAGNLLADSRPYTIPMLNSVYRTLQEDLTDAGVETFPQETLLLQVQPCYTVDPAVQIYINYSGMFDGLNTFTSPFLPANMLGPLRMWERPTGTVQNFLPMWPTNDGLPSRPQSAMLQQWEWRNDIIYMVGAQQLNDCRLRYNQLLPDLVDGNSQVQILRSDRALSYLLGREFAAARGSQMWTYMDSNYQSSLGRMTDRTARKKQRGSHRRRPYGSSGSYWQDGYAWW